MLVPMLLAGSETESMQMTFRLFFVEQCRLKSAHRTAQESISVKLCSFPQFVSCIADHWQTYVA